MERLTKRVGVNEAVPICDFDICAPFIKSGYCKTGMRGGFPRRWERHCNDTCILGRMIDRLADYEDTGLTPEQVVAQKWIPMPEPPNHELSRGDLVRRMDDQQLAQYLYSLTNRDFELQFCQNKPECQELVDSDGGVPEENCIFCLIKYLKGVPENE